MSVSSIATFGSAAIATPTSDANSVKRDDKPADAPPPDAPPPVAAAKAPGTGQFVDKTA
jgi:hypothetical protein